MTFKVLQCHSDQKRRAQVLHRGAVVPRALDATGYNPALQPKSDHYFPVVNPVDGIASETLPSAQQGPVNTPNSAILEGGGKRRRLSSRSSDVMRTGRSTASSQAVVDEPSSQANSSATSDQGNINEEGVTDEMEWSTMNAEEVQYQCNYTDEFDRFLVEILNHY